MFKALLHYVPLGPLLLAVLLFLLLPFDREGKGSEEPVEASRIENQLELGV